VYPNKGNIIMDEKQKLINEILTKCRANMVYISGDLFFSLAFATIDELKNIARELYIKID